MIGPRAQTALARPHRALLRKRFAIVGLAVLAGAVKIVRPYQRGLVERLGKYKTTREPGLTLIVPFIETMQLIDMREQVVDVPPQEVITSDNVVVSVDAVVYYRVQNATISITNVEDSNRSTRLLAATTLRNVLGTKNLSEILSDRENISHLMQVIR